MVHWTTWVYFRLFHVDRTPGLLSKVYKSHQCPAFGGKQKPESCSRSWLSSLSCGIPRDFSLPILRHKGHFLAATASPSLWRLQRDKPCLCSEQTLGWAGHRWCCSLSEGSVGHIALFILSSFCSVEKRSNKNHVYFMWPFQGIVHLFSLCTHVLLSHWLHLHDDSGFLVSPSDVYSPCLSHLLFLLRCAQGQHGHIPPFSLPLLYFSS